MAVVQYLIQRADSLAHQPGSLWMSAKSGICRLCQQQQQAVLNAGVWAERMRLPALQAPQRMHKL